MTKVRVPFIPVKPYAKPYVGLKAGEIGMEVFKSVEMPTKESHPQYGAVIGPFRTKKAAVLTATSGNNPHIQCVADAERIVKGQK